MPPHMSGHTNFNPDTDIFSLMNKVILVTGGVMPCFRSHFVMLMYVFQARQV